MSATASKDNPQPSVKHGAYPWLLATSTCLSAVLCWLYVTKPVIVTGGNGNTSPGETTETIVESTANIPSNVSGGNDTGAPQLIPSNESLPGMTAPKGRIPNNDADTTNKPDPRMLAAGDGSGWENTNARVQHILSADAGDGELSKIVLNVPVLYETRTMRWTLTDVERARNILTRLMVYENNLSKLKQEGKILLADWNHLLEKTVPSGSLRADSPSLPYNHSLRASGHGMQENGSSIKIEQ